MTPAPAPWIQRTEPVRPLVALGFALLLTVVVLDLLLSGQLTVFYDLCFIALCLLLGVRVAHGDFYGAAVLPPMLMLGAIMLLALLRPESVAADDDGFVQAVVTGFARHSVALVVGYVFLLGALVTRSVTGLRPRPE